MSEVERLNELASQGRTREAAVLLLSEVGELAWSDLAPDHLELMDAFCEHALGGLLQRDVVWLIKSPAFLQRLTRLVEDAARSGYKPASSVERLARLRCLMAMSEATRGRLAEAHQLLCSAAGRPSTEVPRPNGQLQKDVAVLRPPELAAAGFLEGFFKAYFAFLRRVGEHDLANDLEASVRPLTARVQEEERRPGIVRALFHNREVQRGYIRLVHASVTASEDGRKELVYLPFSEEQIDQSMAKAADVAWRAVDRYLTSHGYPDGLESRLVRWQLTNAAGDPVGAATRYEGGSIGLPLALAILSSYLGQPVPCHVSVTGALDAWNAQEGAITPVDGVRAKVATAIQTGCRRVYVPAGNAGDLSEDIALENKAHQRKCSISAVEKLEDVCCDTFSDEKDGTFLTTMAGACRGLASLFWPTPVNARPSALVKYRGHVLLSALLFAALFFLEGSFVHLGLAGQEMGLAAWILTSAAAVVVFAVMLWCYALACAALRNRKRWPWLLSAGGLGCGAILSVLLQLPLVPASTDISVGVDAVPIWGVAKDTFFFWLFGWTLLANTFCAVAALSHLAQRGQFLTLRRSLRWQGPVEATFPLRCFVFPWEWGGLALFVVAIVLGYFEVRYISSLRTNVAGATWAATLIMVRDLIFVLGALECLLFYKWGLAAARQKLGGLP